MNRTLSVTSTVGQDDATGPGTDLVSIIANGPTGYVNLDAWRRATIGVVNGATNPVTFTVEGSNDKTNWFTIAYGSGSQAAYTQAALTVAAAAKALLFLPPSDLVRYVRVNVSVANANGTTFLVAWDRIQGI